MNNINSTAIECESQPATLHGTHFSFYPCSSCNLTKTKRKQRNYPAITPAAGPASQYVVCAPNPSPVPPINLPYRRINNSFHISFLIYEFMCAVGARYVHSCAPRQRPASRRVNHLHSPNEMSRTNVRGERKCLLHASGISSSRSSRTHRTARRSNVVLRSLLDAHPHAAVSQLRLFAKVGRQVAVVTASRAHAHGVHRNLLRLRPSARGARAA